jgi:DNA-binding transcriptional regulator WhiA
LIGYRWNELENNLLYNMYFSSDKKDILKNLPNRSWPSIRLQARKLNLHRNQYLRRETNFSPLLNNDTISFYWIGFLFADGYINHKRYNLRLTISAKDEDHMVKYSNFIKGNYKKFSKNNKEYVCSTGQDLTNLPKIIEKFDFKHQKTYYPPHWKNYNFSNELLTSLFIGFFDGDGGMFHNKSSGKITIYKNWLENLNFMHSYFESIFNLKIKQIPKLVRNNKYAFWYMNSKLLKNMKIKALEYDLPILERKWGQIK